MALLDRVIQDDVAEPLPGEPKARRHIAPTPLAGTIHLWLVGKVTRNQVINRLRLAPSDEAQLDEIKVVYDALPAAQKALYFGVLLGAFTLGHVGLIDRGEVKTLIGLS